MLRKKAAESLTVRIFLSTALLLLCAGGITFGFIAWATPSIYTAVITEDLAQQADQLAQKLAGARLADSGPLLDDFIRASGADAMLVGPDGQIAETGSQLAVRALYPDGGGLAAFSGDSSAATYASDVAGAQDEVTVTLSEQASITAQVRFADQSGAYLLSVAPRLEAKNQAVQALAQTAPWLLLVLLAFSLLCALAYSRYIARPVVRLSGIAEKMARLDFNWECGEKRRDEIGRLGRSLDEMARRLSASLEALEVANRALRGEVEQERELDRQRMAFFSAASHELKTPVTILKGQLSGMLEGVGVYRDRDKYLLRALQVAGRMEVLVRELLTVSRMESGPAGVRQETVDLAGLVQRQLALDAELFAQRRQHLSRELAAGLSVTGDAALLGKAVGNLLSNAALYSPPGAQVRVWCGLRDGRPTLTVENSGTQIPPSALPHLFEAFYRADGSRSRSTGGSGLGLYLVRRILDLHRADCTIKNTGRSVLATVRFAAG